MRNIEKAFRKATGVDKVRVAKFVTLNVNMKDSKPEPKQDGTMNTIISLLARGDMNCAGNPFGESPFNNQTLTNPYSATGTQAHQPPTSAAQEAEERRRQQEKEQQEKEEARKKQQEEEEKERIKKEEEEEKKKNSPLGRIFGSLKRFGHALIEPDN